ncbi:hypothetical protein BHM03_00013947 [Ensete ventricosum]|nr:hypothetical protein BHM03_00013947 [Ensete ventricosum]
MWRTLFRRFMWKLGRFKGRAWLSSLLSSSESRRYKQETDGTIEKITDCIVVNCEEGLMVVDLGSDVSLAEKEQMVLLEPQVRQCDRRREQSVTTRQ